MLTALFLVFVLLAAGTVRLAAASPGNPAPPRDAAGNIFSGRLCERVTPGIGGMTQWLLLRGADRAAPILLWLHGGPGSAQMPIHRVTAALERAFVVVHWDQRGAGKSNPPDFDPATMTLEHFLADAREVTALLRARLGAQPLIVLGPSRGTMLGARLVARWPADYAGYIGVGQQVDTLRGAALALDWLGRVAPDSEPDSELVGRAPEAFRDHDLYVRLMQAVEAAGGGMNVSPASLLPRAPPAARSASCSACPHPAITSFHVYYQRFDYASACGRPRTRARPLRAWGTGSPRLRTGDRQDPRPDVGRRPHHRQCPPQPDTVGRRRATAKAWAPDRAQPLARCRIGRHAGRYRAPPNEQDRSLPGVPALAVRAAASLARAIRPRVGHGRRSRGRPRQRSRVRTPPDPRFTTLSRRERNALPSRSGVILSAA